MSVSVRPFPYHKWFAWHPVVTVDRRFTWLRTVWRRPVYSELNGSSWTSWEFVRLDGYSFDSDSPHVIAK